MSNDDAFQKQLIEEIYTLLQTLSELQRKYGMSEKSRYQFLRSRNIGDDICMIYWDTENGVWTYTMVVAKGGSPESFPWQGGFDSPDACYQDAQRQFGIS